MTNAIPVTAYFCAVPCISTTHNDACHGAEAMGDHDDNPWRDVGWRLNQARRRMGLSKRAAARKAGLSEGLWRQLEAGVRKPMPDVTVPVSPRDYTLEAAARAVEVDPAELFAIVGRPYEATEPDEPAVGEVDPADLSALRDEIRTLGDEIRALVHEVRRVATDGQRVPRASSESR